MCLDVDYHYNNQNCIIKSDILENHTQNLDNNLAAMGSSSDFKYRIKNLCGGSLIEHKPLFDPKGENVYVVRNDKIRVYNVGTGELVTELVDNMNGPIVGMHLENESSNECLISCTVSGHVAFWKLKSYVVSEKKKFNFKLASIKRFLVTAIDEKLHGLVHYCDEENASHLVLVDLKQNEIVHRFDFPALISKKDVKMKMADGNGIIAVISNMQLYVINKQTLQYTVHTTKMPLNVVVCHPEQEMIATGEVTGKIFLWSNVLSERPTTTLLHWHHMIVLSLAFSQTGTILYSGGAECVLVKWEINERNVRKDFLPRVSGGIKQISVDTVRDKIAICMDDNSIQIINSTLAQLRTIQDFTQISPYDLGLNQPFPAGIKINSKNHCLVMNGRIGHLQFFSTKSMRLLFNVDITMKNVVPRTRKRNDFSTEVTKSAFSSCGEWMATYECWNDRVSSIDARLKFWSFIDNMQTYSLHTQIEHPHQGKMIAMEFAIVDNSVICASAGMDRVVKIWSLEASEEIQNPKMIWMLIEQVSYKDLPVRCLKFSQDASLLSAGFGNSLCVWDTTTFKLKCSLSAPAVLDGSINRVVISLPQKKKKKKDERNGSEPNMAEKRKKILQLMSAIIKDPSQQLVKDITQEKSRFFKTRTIDRVNAKDLKDTEKKQIFEQVMNTHDLNFNEKLQVLHKLNIYYEVCSRAEGDFVEYISRNACDDEYLYKGLQRGVYEVKSEARYKLLWRFKMWRKTDAKRNRRIITARKLLKRPIREEALKHKSEVAEHNVLPIKNINSITNIIFCSDDEAHLVIVTTQTRLLIWNLLTLKIQGSFKIQCSHIAHDTKSNLIAIFTRYNELFIVHPSPAMTLFHQKSMPNIHDVIWVPHVIPKAQSLRVNWQATSQLLFLTHEQEICTLSSPTDDDEFVDLTSYMYEPNEVVPSTPFAAMISKRETLKKTNEVSIKHILSNDSGSVKEIINLSNHAMPPLSKLSKDLVSSLLTSQHRVFEMSRSAVAPHDEEMDAHEVSDDEDDKSAANGSKKALRRKTVEEGEKIIKERINKQSDMNIDIDREMSKLQLNEFDSFCIVKK